MDKIKISQTTYDAIEYLRENSYNDSLIIENYITYGTLEGINEDEIGIGYPFKQLVYNIKNVMDLAKVLLGEYVIEKTMEEKLHDILNFAETELEHFASVEDYLSTEFYNGYLKAVHDIFKVIELEV